MQEKERAISRQVCRWVDGPGPLPLVISLTLAAYCQHKGSVQNRVVAVQRQIAAAAARNHQFALPEGDRVPNQRAGLQDVDGGDDGFNTRGGRVGRIGKQKIENPVKVGPDLRGQNDPGHRGSDDTGLPDAVAAALSRLRR